MTHFRFHGQVMRGLVPHRPPTRSPLFEGRFGRMFRRLQPAPALPDDVLRELAAGMQEGQPSGGWGSPSDADLDNPDIPAGYTYLGQFVDHDITFDPMSSLQKLNDPDALVDFRTPRYDLDSLYGSGPADEPFQYDQTSSPAKLLLEPNVKGEMDVPRNSQGIALIGDPRNDENVIVNQLHFTFAKLHNKFVDEVVSEGLTGDAGFIEAQKRTRWHYQWAIVHDFLPRICGRELIESLFKKDANGVPDLKLRFYLARTKAYMPVEFSVAAFRFGHSQIRPVYDLNEVVTERPIFAPGDSVGELDDLRGRRPLPGAWTVDWTRYFAIGGSAPQLSRRIDTKLATALFDLPGEGDPLPVRNLKRGEAFQLPSGQDVAAAIGAPVLHGSELKAPEPTPLWFYVLKESELAGGTQLGAVGARIVAEVLLGLLQTDSQSFFSQNPSWQPTTVPDADGDGIVGFPDLIAFATS